MGPMNSVDWYVLAVSTFITCRLWLTVNWMLDGILEYHLNRDSNEED